MAKQRKSKKMISLATIFLVFCSMLLLSSFLKAKTVDQCYDDHTRCRERALSGDYSVFYTTLLLTVCDAALPVCLVLAATH